MTAPRRALVLGLWLALLLAAAGIVARAPFSADLSAFLPSAPDAQQRALIEQLQSGAASRTLLLAIDGGSAPARAAASRALAAALREAPAAAHLQHVANGDADADAAIGDWVFRQRYLLSPAVNAQRFSADGLRDAIDDTLSLLGTPAGARIKPLLQRDPTGEALRIAEDNLGAGAPRSVGGTWASRDGRRALLVAALRADGADLDAQQAAIDAVRQAFAALPQREGLSLVISGTPTFAIASRAQIEAEVKRLAIAGAALMGALLWAAFGSLAALAVAALPVASGVLAGVAAVAVGFPTVHGITLGFGTTLIGEAVDYAIYALIQSRSAGWHGWLRQGWPTVRLGLLTSVAGFAALACSGFPGLAQLGVFSLVGLLAAAATTRWLLPVLMPAGAAGGGLRPWLARAARGALQRLPRWRLACIALGVAAALLIVLQRGPVWHAELSSLSPVPPAALAEHAALQADLGRGDALALVIVQRDDAEATLRAAEAAAARLDALVDAGRIGGYVSPTRLLPSLHTQTERQSALPDAPALRAALDGATAGGALPAARLEPFIADVQQARAAPLLEPAAVLRDSPLAPLLAGLFTLRPGGGATALLPVHGAAGAAPDAAAVQAVLAGLPGVRWVEVGPELTRLYRHYLGEAQAQALLGAAAVLLLIGLALRSLRRVAATALPLLLAVAVVAAGFVAAGVALSILHLVGLLLVVAIGSNYALFFDLLRGDVGAADDDTLASLLLANATTVLAFGLLALSEIPALSAIGRVVAPGALLALLFGAACAVPRRPRAARV